MYSLIIGMLMLAKAEYSILAAMWLWALHRRSWRVLIGTLVLHFIPLLVWIGVLRLVGLSYYNHEVEVYDAGAWFVTLIRQGALRELYQTGAHLLGMSIGELVIAFSPLVLMLAAFGVTPLSTVPRRFRIDSLLALIAICVFVVAIKRPQAYLLFDAFFVIYPLAAHTLLRGAQYLADRLPTNAFAQNPDRLLLLALLIECVVAWYLSVPADFRLAL